MNRFSIVKRLYATATVGPVSPIRQHIADMEKSMYMYQRFLIDREARLCDAYTHKLCDRGCKKECLRIKYNELIEDEYPLREKFS